MEWLYAVELLEFHLFCGTEKIAIINCRQFTSEILLRYFGGNELTESTKVKSNLTV